MFISPDDLCYCGWFCFTLDSLRYTMLLLLCLVILLFTHATQSEYRELLSLTLVLLKVSSCQREGKRWPSNQVREGSLSCWPRYALPQFFKSYTTNIIFAVSVEFSLGFFWCCVLLYWIWWRNLYETPLLYATFQNLYIHHSRSTSTLFINTKVK